MKVRNFLLIIATFVISVLLLSGVVRGDRGNPLHFQKDLDTRVGGPFESSNSTSRYSLIKSFVDTGSVHFSEDLARFSAPDVVYYNEKFFTIFTPGISFIGLPFYIAGNYLGAPQLVTYLSVTLFLIADIFLIAYISRKLGASFPAALLGGVVFGFSTNALSYSLSLTQHLTSTAILLLSFIVASENKSFLRYCAFGMLCGVGALVDIPNLFLLTPIGLYMVWKSFQTEEVSTRINIIFKPAVFGILIGIIPFIVLFGIYNMKATGSYTLLGQSIGQSNYFDSAEKKLERAQREKNDTDQKKSILPFKTRNQIQGVYILGFSDERSWLYYSPIVLLGIIGLYHGFLAKKNKTLLSLCISVGVLNFVLYAMFGDPWGGWSFGPRYLIPTTAVLAVGVGLFIQKYRRRVIPLVLFLILLGYSVYITFLGALTTNAIPPKQEALALSEPIPYTYIYNLHLMELNSSSSLVYNIFFKGSLDLWVYHLTISCITFLFIGSLLSLVIFSKKHD